MSRATFIKAHLGVIVGMDFFTVEAMTWLGLVRYHVLFAIDTANRKVEILGIAVNPGGPWMEQMAKPRRCHRWVLARTQSEPERFRGALCAFDQERMP